MPPLSIPPTKAVRSLIAISKVTSAPGWIPGLITAVGACLLPLESQALTTIDVNAGVAQGANPIVANHVSQGFSEQEALNTHSFWQNMSGRFKEAKTNLVRVSPGRNILVEKNNGVLEFDFSKFDPVIDAIIQGGGQPLMVMAAGQDFSRPEEEIEEIIEAIVDRYKDRIVYWEICNEPNHQNAQAIFPDVDAYIRYYDLAADTIRANFEQAKIGGMALTGVNVKDRTAPEGSDLKIKDVWLIPFLNHVDLNNKPFDFVSWHYYANGQGPHNRAHSHLTEEIDDVRALLTTRGLPADVLITEYNLSTKFMSYLDQNEEAAYVLEFIDHLTKKYASNPVKLFFFQPKDAALDDVFNVSIGTNLQYVDRFNEATGYLTYDNFPKAVYNALKLYGTMPETKVSCTLPAISPTGLGAISAKSGTGAAAKLEVLVWNNSNYSRDVNVNSVNLPFTSGAEKEYSRVDVNDRSGNAKYNVVTAETTLVEDLDGSNTVTPERMIKFTSNSYLTPTFTMKPYSVAKLVFKSALSAPAVPANVRVNKAYMKNSDGLFDWLTISRYQNNIIRWDAAAGATAYNVLRSTSSTGAYKPVGKFITGQMFVDPRTSPNADYFYKVEAVNVIPPVSTSAASGAGKWQLYTSEEPKDPESIGTTPLSYLNRFDANSSIAQFSSHVGTWTINSGHLYNADSNPKSDKVFRATLRGATFSRARVEFDLKIDGDGGWGGIDLVNVANTTEYRLAIFANGSATILKNGATTGFQTLSSVYPRDNFQHYSVFYDAPAKKIILQAQGEDILTFTTTETLDPIGYVRVLRNSQYPVRFDNVEVNHLDSFLDSFSDVGMANWMPKGGNWSVVSTKLQQQSTTAGNYYAFNSLANIQNGTVEADLQILGNLNPIDHLVALGIKRTNPEDLVRTENAGYEVYIRKNTSGAGYMLGIWDNLAAATVGAEVATSIDPVANSVHLKVTFENDLIKVYFNKTSDPISATPLFTRNRLSFISGTLALITKNANATFDNVKLSK